MSAKTKAGNRGAPSSTDNFERLLKEVNRRQYYVLRLYITGTTPRSSRAIANIRSLCEEYLPGHYELEVVDIYQQPQMAMDAQIIAAPTLVKQMPKPPIRMVGDLSRRDKVLIGLNLIKDKWVKA
jgi:circadian clock protein KaiB